MHVLFLLLPKGVHVELSCCERDYFLFTMIFLDYLWTSNGFFPCCNACGFRISLLGLFLLYAQTNSVP